MSILKATVALEKRLSTAYPTIVIAYEGVSIDPPSNNLYFRVQHVIDKPDDPVFGSVYRRENINFQVFIISPTNKGVNAALVKAQEIQTLYKRGTMIPVDNLRIQIFKTPQIAGTAVISDKIVIPVLIPVTVEVYD